MPMSQLSQSPAFLQSFHGPLGRRFMLRASQYGWKLILLSASGDVEIRQYGGADEDYLDSFEAGQDWLFL
jgi:hypothetical protein